MADTIQIESNALELLRRWRHLPDRMREGVRRGLQRALLLVEDRVRANTRVKARHGAAGLLGRLTSRVLVQGGNIDGLIGFRKTRGFPYELSQEFGAKARPGGAMAMPVSPEARKLSAAGASARTFPRKLFIPQNTHVLAESRLSRKGVNLVVHYVLLKSIPPRLNFRKTVLASGDLISSEVVNGLRRRGVV